MVSCGYLIAVSGWLAACGAPVDFDTQVMPVLTKAGCNAGACHGAALGQGGFKLSLLGQSAEDDYQTIVQELEGRRVNLSRPAESLLIAKPTERVDHTGGLRLAPGSAGEALILQWLSAGAPRLQARRLVDWKIEPRSVLLNSPGDYFDLRVRANFDQGQSEDVTRWTVFSPTDTAALTVEEDGRVVTRRRGVHTLVLRYLDRVAAVQVIVPLGEATVDLGRLPRGNLIDEETSSLLEALRIEPAPSADDATFLRRVRLDLTGRLPPTDEVRSFLADQQPDKREQLVARLLESSDYADYWSLKWSRWLRTDSRRMDAEGAQRFTPGCAEIAAGSPLNRMVAALLTAEGDSHTIGPANFTRATLGPREQAEHVSQLFLGARLGCANCHNHPLDRWTQDDYHGLAALFARLQRGREVSLAARGEVTHPRTGEPARPRLPGVAFLQSDGQGRESLAAWLVDKDNSLFARAWVNRLWREMFGRGLVEPVDDLRDTNPATHPQLLTRLAADFAANDFDVRRLLRQIATSATYGRGAAAADLPAGSDRYYACAGQRPLEPEVLVDALCDVTGIPEKYGDLSTGTRGVQLYDVRTPSTSLDILGRCLRPEACDAAASPATLAARLHQINGPLLNAKIAAPEGRLQGRLTSGASNEALLEELYLCALSRLPTADERAHCLEAFTGDASQRREVWEDFLWALLNCREFTTNH